ncbi:hypothetical protein [Rhodoferax sp.]|uniref:hypothetical protein n=1 Tax=Rhodoferax sp. TaxID=50421 RepID=UPI0027777291|nr:hypothetical protein [Rhodoferax sp.]
MSSSDRRQFLHTAATLSMFPTAPRSAPVIDAYPPAGTIPDVADTQPTTHRRGQS